MTNATVTTNFDGMGPFLQLAHEAINDGVTAAAMGVAEEQRKLMQTNSKAYQGPTVRAGGAHSSPGGVPFVQTGRLRDSIGWTKAENLTARAGSDMGDLAGFYGTFGPVKMTHGYGYYLEFGTSKMAARPWARRGLYRAINSGRAFRLFRKAAQAKLGTAGRVGGA